MTVPNKKRVKVTPKWLDVMVPGPWFAVAEALAELAETHKVPDDRMRRFIIASSNIGGLPLVEGVRMFITGELKLIAGTQADTATEPTPNSPIILPPGLK
jgi:hypothetical protein